MMTLKRDHGVIDDEVYDNVVEDVDDNVDDEADDCNSHHKHHYPAIIHYPKRAGP